MKWQFLSLIVVVVAAMLMLWRSSGKKTGGCGCKSGGCAHEPESGPKKEEAVR